MSEPEKKQAEQLKKQGDVREALDQATPPPEAHERPPRKSLIAGLVVYAVLIAVFLAVRIVLIRSPLPLTDRALDILQRASLGAVFIVLALLLGKAVQMYFLPRFDTVTRYNLKRILRLAVFLAIVIILVSAVFVGWYTALVSVGVLSLILGFALQTPITSFIGWIYILVRKPYRVGDRILIGGAAGDVIDVSYLDTTLWEFGGEYLSTDHPSGRLIKFPNSNVLTTPVYNYSWPLFPYIWNEVKFHIAYDSDLEWVGQTMKEVAEQELGEQMRSRVRVHPELQAKTPVDHVEGHEQPAALFRLSDNTWLEVILRYLVDPKQAGRVKTRLIQELLARLKAEPEKVLFPKSNMR